MTRVMDAYRAFGKSLERWNTLILPSTPTWSLGR